jgi:hypothetical protein
MEAAMHRLRRPPGADARAHRRDLCCRCSRAMR